MLLSHESHHQIILTIPQSVRKIEQVVSQCCILQFVLIFQQPRVSCLKGHGRKRSAASLHRGRVRLKRVALAHKGEERCQRDSGADVIVHISEAKGVDGHLSPHTIRHSDTPRRHPAWVPPRVPSRISMTSAAAMNVITNICELHLMWHFFLLNL